VNFKVIHVMHSFSNVTCSYSCAALYKISTDSMSHSPSVTAELLVKSCIIYKPVLGLTLSLNKRTIKKLKIYHLQYYKILQSDVKSTSR